ncbi:MAG: type II toxin-antitoxin system RelE/ParE family toxin [Methanocella sp.]
MSKRVVYAPSAIRDLEGTLNYIAHDNPEAATRVAREIREAIGLLGDFPFLGRSMKEPGFGGHRALVIGNYLVFYVVTEEDIQIRRLIHGAREYGALLKDE